MTHATLEINTSATAGKARARVRGVTVASRSRRPPLFVPREDLFFYTRQWQEGERESAEARAAGELRVFDSAPTCSIGCARQKTDLAYRYAAEPRFKGRLKKKHRAAQERKTRFSTADVLPGCVDGSGRWD